MLTATRTTRSVPLRLAFVLAWLRAGIAAGAPPGPPVAAPKTGAAKTDAAILPGKTVVASPPSSPGTPAAVAPARALDTVLADIIAAVGGATALARHRSLHTRMEITFKGLGITGSAEHYAVAGDKVLTITTIPNLASTREGSDGIHFWSEDPINGLRVLDGAEAEQARIEAAWNAELRLKELFATIEVKNEISDTGGSLECLTLTPKTGPPMTNCFDAKTHLMALQRGVRSGPQGDMPFSARLMDWRQIGDVKLAFGTEMQIGPLAFTGHVTSVEMDEPVDAALFMVPTSPAREAAGAARTGKGKSRGAKKIRPAGGSSPPAAGTPASKR